VSVVARAPDVELELLEGSTALARAAILAGCRFFAGYPMSPFTSLLESMSRLLPADGGVCINAESEIEGINMALGAAATGARAATGSCGQGIALMQEAIAETALNETPLVIFNMARNQQDYFQCTRGGGWGDYRTLTLAPKDIPEAVEHTQLLFHLADSYRVPTILYGDPLIAQTRIGVRIEPLELPELPPKDWALDGTLGGTGGSRQVWTWAMGKATDPGPGPDRHWRAIAEKFEHVAANEQRWEGSDTGEVDALIVAFGSAAKFTEYVVDQLAAEGRRLGHFRPITLWPFPGEALRRASSRARRVLVFELNGGQMIDDVRQFAHDRDVIRPIGGVSIHDSGLSYGRLLDAPVIRERILAALEAE
jgi:2-oxoglutarate/2-oxoacid ferredoxin oxidoreductase subunit alpha